jgi:hypothetical protein
VFNENPEMHVLTVVNVVDAPPITPTPIFPLRKPTLALAVVNCYPPPLDAIETLLSPSMMTLNIPNRSSEALLSLILNAHDDGKTRRSSSPRLTSPVPTASAYAALEGDKNKGMTGEGNFVGFDMLTSAMGTRTIKLTHSEGLDSDSDDSTEQNSTSSSSSTLVDDDYSLEDYYFRIHEFTTVTKLISASHAMHRSSFFVPPRRDRRRPSYHIKRLYRMTHQENDESNTVEPEPVFNFGFDADPDLDEDFGVLSRQREAETRALARACDVAETEGDVWKTGEAQSLSPAAEVPKRIARVPVPRYEDLEHLDTSRDNESRIRSVSISTPTAQSELEKGINGSSSMTEQQIIDLLWGNRPIDLAQYWSSSTRRID